VLPVVVALLVKANDLVAGGLRGSAHRGESSSQGAASQGAVGN
jgi:hypothetical protein